MLPQCRYLIVCRNGRVTRPGERVTAVGVDGAEELTGAGGGELVLADPVAAITPEPGKRYPIVMDQLLLSAQMSGGSGPHALNVELLRWYLGEAYQVFATPTTTLDFGRDRATARAFHVRLRPIIFPTAGQYTFRLLCDGVEIGRAELELMEPTT